MARKVTTETSATSATTVVAKRKTTKKQRHPLAGVFKKEGKKLVAQATANWPFEALPTDFDPKIHGPLTKKDFKTEAAFFDYLAVLFEGKAKIMRTKAETSRTMGTGEERKAAKRLGDVAAQVEALVAKLSPKLGADAVQKIIANAKAKLLEKATAVAAGTKA